MPISYVMYEYGSSEKRTLCTADLRNTFDMDTANDRLRKAREAAGFETAADAARAWKVNQNTLTSHENGNRPLSRNAAVTYAKKLGLTPGYLLYGEAAEGRSEAEEADADYAEFLRLTEAHRALIRGMMRELRSASPSSQPADPRPTKTTTARKTPRARRSA